MSVSSLALQIRPFPQVTTYPTSWAGEMTFDQIYEDLAHYASNVMKRNSFRPHEIPECLQNGFMVLWETLVQQHDFLAEKTRRQAVFFIMARCKISTIRYQEGMYDSLDALISSDWHNTADEHVIDGMQRRQGERWAGWATQVDIRADIERIMHKLAAKYEHSLKHLVALYHLTTQVSRIDAAKIVGVDPLRWYRGYALPVLQDLRYEFAEAFLDMHDFTPAGPVALPEERQNGGRFSSPYACWREQYERGNTEPAEALAATYRDTPCIGGAIRAQIEGKSYAAAAEAQGRNPSTFRKHMKRAARMLAAAYT